VLANQGYNTVGFVNNPQVGDFVGLHKGHRQFFEIWQGVTSRNIFVCGGCFLQRILLLSLGREDHGARKTNKLVRSWLKTQISEGQPFYMFLHYIEPHNPIAAPYPYKKKFITNESLKQIDWAKVRKVAHNPLVVFTDDIRLNEAENDYLISLYDGEIAYVDHVVGEVVDALRDNGILDETFLIITADHGEHFGEHGLYSHVASLYEPIVHIPLVIRYPRIFKPSQEYEQLVQHIDIFPTMLDLLQNKKNRLVNLAGQSLLPRNGKITTDKKRSIISRAVSHIR